MKLKLLVTFFVICLGSIAQTPAWQWANTSGGSASEDGISVATDASNNVFVTGYFFSPTIVFGTYTLTNSGNYDVYIVKYNSAGNVLWAKSAGGIYDDVSTGIATNSSGEVIVTGSFTSPTMIFGTYTLTNAGVTDIFITKYDTNGNVIWSKREGDTNSDEANSITTDGSGNIFITGQYQSNTITFGTYTLTNMGIGDIYVTKYDGSGNVQWAQTVGDNFLDVGNGITTDASGNVYVTGYFKSASLVVGTYTLNNAAAGNADFFIMKYDGSGNPQWAKNSGGIFEDVGTSVTHDATGNIYVTGYFKSPTFSLGVFTFTNAATGTCDIFTAKYNSSGTEIWAKGAGGNIDDIGYGIATDIGGNVYVSGHIHSTNMIVGTYTLTNAGVGVGDVFILKYDNSGTILWGDRMGGTADDGSSIVATDASGNAYIAGYFNSTSITFGSYTLTNVGSADMFVAKISTVTAVENLQNVSNEFHVYPNPTSGKFQLKGLEELDGIEIYNSVGEKIYSSTLLSSNSSINISDHAKGIYFVQIRSSTKNIRKKIILD